MWLPNNVVVVNTYLVWSATEIQAFQTAYDSFPLNFRNETIMPVAGLKRDSSKHLHFVEWLENEFGFPLTTLPNMVMIDWKTYI